MEKDLKDVSRFRQKTRNTEHEIDYRVAMNSYIQSSSGTYYEKLENFTKYLSRQTLARFLALYEVFKLAQNVQGSIVECGVNWGGGLMGFALMSAVLEPVNLQRQIIGFDTFEGFTGLAEPDRKSTANEELVREGGFAADSFEDLKKCVELFNANRFISHVPKVSLVSGDARKTIPTFIEQCPYLVVSLLHLDFDLYEPTKVAIENFIPRIPKGGIVIFDELNNATWPGETVAVNELLGVRNLRIERFPFEPHISYAILD
jgi:hypothetical protein